MRWRRAAIAVCASVAALAGAVSVVADAIAADQGWPDLAGSVGASPAAAGGAAPPHRTFRTIDTLAGTCRSPDPAPAGSPQVSCDGRVRLTVGASEQEVIRGLGEPRSRRNLEAGGDAWDYAWQSDGTGGLSESAFATLRFDGHRFVDSVEYIFK